jgi:hypothetical protein
MVVGGDRGRPNRNWLIHISPGSCQPAYADGVSPVRRAGVDPGAAGHQLSDSLAARVGCGNAAKLLGRTMPTRPVPRHAQYPSRAGQK